MSFLKRFFKKEQEIKKVKLNSSELPDWFEKEISWVLDDVVKDLNGLFSEIKEEIETTRKLLHELEMAKLRNEKITLKEKQFMEGNRLAYIKKTRDFLASVMPAKMPVNEAQSYVGKYKEAVEDFTKNSYRAFQITSNFFGDELNETAKRLKKIDDSVKKISALLNRESVVVVNDTKRKINEMNSLIQKREELMDEIEKEEKNYEDLKIAKADYDLKIIKLKKHPAYIELQELNEKLKGIEDELKILKSSFLDNFMQVEKALKKISKLDSEELTAKYLDDPVTALLNDAGLEILKVLQRTKEALEADQLEIDEKKKEKILTRMSELTKDYLVAFIVKHNDLELKKSQLLRQIRQNSSMNDLNDLIYKLDHTKDKQAQNSERIKKLNQQLDKIEIDEIKSEIQENLKTLSYDVEVSV